MSASLQSFSDKKTLLQQSPAIPSGFKTQPTPRGMAARGQVEFRRRPAENPTAPTVLVADDDPSVRCLICETLRGAGLRVLEAADGRDALEVAGDWNGPIDLLVTDVEMPNIDGPTLAEKLVHRRPGLPVLYVSGLPEVPGAEKSRPFTFLPKPFRLVALLEQVRRLLGRGPWEKHCA